jgi:transposase
LPGQRGQSRFSAYVASAALRREHVGAYGIGIEESFNGLCFLTCVTQFLAPSLRAGDIVVMDNLGIHKAVAVRRAIRAAGTLLLVLPPYSPDLNPIEQAFSKLKTLLQKENAHTMAQTTTCIGQLLDGLTAEQCAHYFQAAGYST